MSRFPIKIDRKPYTGRTEKEKSEIKLHNYKIKKIEDLLNEKIALDESDIQQYFYYSLVDEFNPKIGITKEFMEENCYSIGCSLHGFTINKKIRDEGYVHPLEFPK